MMKRVIICSVFALIATSGCAGCLGIGEGEDDDARDAIELDAPANNTTEDGGFTDDHDASGTADAGDPTDAEATPAVCGDGAVHAPEICDDGNTADDDYCSADCGVITGACGDGTAQPNEACDDGNTDDGDYCASDCAAVIGVCGDTTTQANEACDDGNVVDGDYCDAQCGAVTGSCGDGTLQANEACDDGVVQAGCDVAHDGGDGACVAPGMCSPNYVMVDGVCQPEVLDFRVIIDVANDCSMAVTPLEITVPRGQSIYIDWFNRSRWYAVDVWLSYGGGYTDLPLSATWDEPIEHCANINPYTAYADITTACSSHRFYIRCNGQ